MATAFISLGSNLGDRAANVQLAIDRLSDHACIEVRKYSSVYETEPVGGPEGQNNYFNAAAGLETVLPPVDFLATLQAIETAADRKREVRWGPRILDLDLLFYDDLIISDDELEVPHPRMHERIFVLQPLAEIAPDAIHPVLEMTVAALYENLVNPP